MDYFNNWTLSESDISRLVDLSTSTIQSILSDSSSVAESWPDQPTNTSTYSSFDADSEGLSTNSRNSSEASDADSPWGERAIFATHSEECALESENQRKPLVIEKELAYHRILRRRIQNRNAQRNFRRRQENERRVLEEQLRTAEQQCEKLRETCSELDSVVNVMRDRLKRLEAENSVLRTKVFSMPWRKDLP